MSYLARWAAISARIHGLMKAAELDARLLAVKSEDTYGRGNHLRKQMKCVCDELIAFRASFQDRLPVMASKAIEDFVPPTSALLDDSGSSLQVRQEQGWAAAVKLAIFESELAYLLSDRQEVIKARAERAFVHLQRSLVVDSELRKRWSDAHGQGETCCEGLGAVHLLLHGIWAFKINAHGARTDLVFSETALNEDEIQRSSEGLVLTEWKRAVKESEAAALFEQARRQAKLYEHGALVATELTRYRYLVVVSAAQVNLPADLVDGDVTYRHVNIAVAPQSPSRASR